MAERDNAAEVRRVLEQLLELIEDIAGRLGVVIEESEAGTRSGPTEHANG